MAQTTADGADYKERLIANVKKEVKQLMEEAVTKKYVHEESSSVTSLCGAVEACLSQGLRRRALGLFKTSSTTALLHKIAKSCPEAEHISKMVQDIESNDPNKRSSSSSDSFNRPPMLKKGSSNSMSTASGSSASMSGASTSAQAAASMSASSSSMALATMKYLWIRLALYEKRLTKIIEYLVSNAQSFYDRDSLVADPDYGSILSSLLVGPCALDFTRAKTADCYWTDPHADELVQRQRFGRRSSSTSSRPPIVNFKRSLNASSDDASSCSLKSLATVHVAKDYVESLHQNSKATLLYGKNNVQVQPKDVKELMLGYLSLHQYIQTLTIKWTPNQLMNGCNELEEEEEDIDKEAYWAYALNINVDDIVYVHCHQSRGKDFGGTVILVGQDGVQRPPIHFPEGGHMQQFLSCLETGLLPHGQLDPPLWSQRGIGRMFLWPKSMRRRILPSVMESMDETPIDFVFRIVNKSQHEEYAATHSILDFVRSTPKRRAQLSSCSTTGSSDCSNKSLSIDQQPLESPLVQQHVHSASIEIVCSTMRRQIISRAFYGWLAYCRHLSTVRQHLSGLVHSTITPEMGPDSQGLTKKRWYQLNANGRLDDPAEFYRLVYYGGVHEDLRKEVWPYLLGHYAFGTNKAQRQRQDTNAKHFYETTMSEWLAVEAIVRQREKEKAARALAKLSSGSNSGNERTVRPANPDAGGELENEVFDDESDMSDLEFDDEQRQQRQHNDEAAGFLNVGPIPRAMKTSTDSGHVDEGIDELDEDERRERELEREREQKKVNSNQNQYQLTEKDLQPSCSNSTASSYETVGGAPQQSVLSPEFLSADDLQAQLPHDEDAGKSQPKASTSAALANEERSPRQENNVEQMAPLVEQPEGNNEQLAPLAEQPEGNGEELAPLVELPEGEQLAPLAEQPEGNGEQLAPLAEQPEGNGEQLAPLVDQPEANGEQLAPLVEQPEGNAPNLDALNLEAHNLDAPNLDAPNRDAPNLDALQEPACGSPASSNGGVYTAELLDNFALNLHRIEKDVQRCDRNYWYFANENLDKLRNVITTYVWEHQDIGYMQGMCDLVAPLLVIFDDEALTYSCFRNLMDRMLDNFPNGRAMDAHFANMRSLIQILDSEMYDMMDQGGDYTHFYFCYRWFLLDFKRELVYDDVFLTWETIWAAKHVASSSFVLFLALGLLEIYRDVILSNSMDFTDVIKFFNEMAERHNVHSLLNLARCLVLQLQIIVENENEKETQKKINCCYRCFIYVCQNSTSHRFCHEAHIL